jgi:arylsulfatase A-like enzyme
MKPSHRLHLTTLLGLSLLASASARAAGLPDTSKMNLLFVIIEDCYAGVWGCYGNAICQTPHLDGFARTATQFDAAYVPAVCCNPSRASFLTGLRPLTSPVWSNGQVMSVGAHEK